MSNKDTTGLTNLQIKMDSIIETLQRIELKIDNKNNKDG